MEALEAIKKRRSIRRYLSRPIAREILEKIVDAGRRARSANNIQPWEFMVVSLHRKTSRKRRRNSTSTPTPER